MHRHVRESTLPRISSGQAEHLERVSELLKTTFAAAVFSAEKLPHVPLLGSAIKKAYAQYRLGKAALQCIETTAIHNVHMVTNDAATERELACIQQDNSAVALARTISVHTVNRGVYNCLPGNIKKIAGQKIAGNWLMGYMENELLAKKGRYS